MKSLGLGLVSCTTISHSQFELAELGLLALSLLLLATLVSPISSSSASSAAGLNDNSIESISDHDEEIAEVLTELEEQVEIALDKLGSAAAEIDIDVIFDDDDSSSAGSGLDSPFQEESAGDAADADKEEDERFGGGEWAVIVPRVNSVPAPVLPFNDADLQMHAERLGVGSVQTSARMARPNGEAIEHEPRSASVLQAAAVGMRQRDWVEFREAPPDSDSPSHSREPKSWTPPKSDNPGDSPSSADRASSGVSLGPFKPESPAAATPTSGVESPARQFAEARGGDGREVEA
ncbi:hypothetical protein Gpo141_00011689 [Globisporangium polare]